MAETAPQANNAKVSFKGKAEHEMKGIAVPTPNGVAKTKRAPAGVRKAAKKGLVSDKALAKAIKNA